MSGFDDMDDDLFDAAGEAAAEDRAIDMELAAKPRLASAPMGDEGRLFKQPCDRCGGSGSVVIGYLYPRSVSCFGCKGKGHKLVKTHPDVLAARRKAAAEGRARREQQKAEELARKREAFEAQYPAEVAWMRAKFNSFDFAKSMVDALMKWGSLTAGQLAAVQRCMERDAQREAERAAAVANAPQVEGISKIEEAFAVAKGNGIKYPKLRLARFKFSPAGPNSKNPGAVYVLDAERKDEFGKAVYLGKVMGGRLQLLRNAQEHEAAVLEAIKDPEAAAVAYGKQYGACSICGRELSNQESIDRGIGPICASKFGW